MPFVRSKEDAEFVERYFSDWEVVATIRRFAYDDGRIELVVDLGDFDDARTKNQLRGKLSAFIAGLYAERDRAGAIKDTSPARSADG